MCEWYYKNGRCGEAFPTNENQFMFIRDDVVTPDTMKTKKAECNAKSFFSPVSERIPSVFELNPLTSLASSASSVAMDLSNDYHDDYYYDYYDVFDKK
jgi:hypothetical protein